MGCIEGVKSILADAKLFSLKQNGILSARFALASRIEDSIMIKNA